MRIHDIVERTAAEGPGMRFCIWVQGCSRHCPGCFNPQTWTRAGGFERAVSEIVGQIDATEGIEGITLLGGEPFEQVAECVQLCHAVRKRGLSVVAFTGYTFDELQASKDDDTHRLLSEIDLLIDGPFLKDR